MATLSKNTPVTKALDRDMDINYRYAYRRYALGNILTISGYVIIPSDPDLAILT
jgi:hypothetical protein